MRVNAMPSEVIDTTDSLIQSLKKYPLLTSGQLKEVSNDFSSLYSDARSLLRELVQRSWLSPYQANLLLQGRGHELFLDPYIVLARLGEGGSGLVLKARHRRMQRIVAIKLIRKSLLTDSNVVARFHREIEVASQVSHPNVVHAYDAGPIGGTFALIMEYVEGINLDTLVKDEGPLPLSRACDYIRQAAVGMQHVHEKGLIHRDIKPSNLLMSPAKDGEGGNGTIKVLDLGLARLCGHKAQVVASSQLTTMGSVMMGTPDYMAPEQAIDLRGADIRADIYSLGCTLFFLITGQPPFPAGSLAQKLMKHQAAPVPSIVATRPELPETLDSVLQKMMAKNPADRYQTPEEVAEALGPMTTVDRRTGVRRTLAGTWNGKSGVTQMEVPTAIPVLTKRRRSKRLAAAAAAFLLIAGIGAGYVAFSGSTASSPENSPQAERKAAPPAPVPLDPLTVLGEARGRHWGYLSSLVFSPDGKLLATVSNGTAVHIWDTATLSEVLTIPTPTRHVGSVAFSPDGRRLATSVAGQAPQTGEIKIWDVATGKESKSWTHPGQAGNSLSYSADGESLALVHSHFVPQGGAHMVFRTWDASNGKEKRSPLEVANCFNGRLIANGALGMTITGINWKVWDLAKGTSDVEVSLGANRGIPMHVVAPDGQSLIAVNQKPGVVNASVTTEVHVVNLASMPADAQAERVLTHTIQEDFYAHMIAPGPRAQTVMLWGRSPDNTRAALRIWDLSGEPKRLALVNFPSQISLMTVSPDGKTLALSCQDNCIRLFDAASLTERLPDNGHRGNIQYLAFADNDQSLISAGSQDWTARSWDHAHGKEKNRLAATVNPNFGGNLATGPGASAVVVWNSQSARWMDPLSNKFRDIPVGEEGLNWLAVAPDSRTVAMIINNRLKVWDATTGAGRLSPIPNVNPTGQMVFSADSKRLAFTNQQVEEGKASISIRIVDTETAVERINLSENFNNVMSLALSPDGRSLAAGTWRMEGQRNLPEWKIWELGNNASKPLLPAPQFGHMNLLYAPNGNNLLGWTFNRLDLWDTTTGKSRFQKSMQQEPGKPFNVRSAAISRDGQRVAYALHDGRLFLVESATGTLVREWKLSGPPSSMALSSDGRQIAVGGTGGLIQVYRLPGTMAPN